MIPHGTRFMILKPGSILGAAEADVGRYQRNARSQPGDGGRVEHYAFHRLHVRKAMRNGYGKGFDIIVEALKRPRARPGQRQGDDQGTLPRRGAAAGGDRRER